MSTSSKLWKHSFSYNLTARLSISCFTVCLSIFCHKKNFTEHCYARGDSIDLSVINPRREKSGVYKVTHLYWNIKFFLNPRSENTFMHLSQVIIRNAQGSDERDINVNIMGKKTLFRIPIIHCSLFHPDKPTPPLTFKILLNTFNTQTSQLRL